MDLVPLICTPSGYTFTIHEEALWYKLKTNNVDQPDKALSIENIAQRATTKKKGTEGRKI